MEGIAALKSRLGSYRRKVIETGEHRVSAVLIPLFDRNGEISLIFTRRTGQVKHHKHQISFPGGVREDGDEKLQDTVLREVEEEIGLTGNHIEIIGAIDDIATVTGFRITPFAGIVPSEYSFVLNRAEIKELIPVPVRLLLQPSVFSSGYRSYKGEKHHSYYFRVNRRTIIWGATARILAQFLEVAFMWKASGLETDTGSVISPSAEP
jgi:8-oxo-dGTP pyrophosphatase MutT (NUDIX family)